MQFNSYIFIMVFLPIFVLGYFALNKINLKMGKIFIAAAGAVFYVYGGWEVTLIFCASILWNLVLALAVERMKQGRKILVAGGIAANIGLLFYYKYFNFAVVTVNEAFHKSFSTKELLLPIGISFFTFQQIMYLVAVYRQEIKKVDAIDYLAYILYFPKLVMGPLVEAGDFMAQLNDKSVKSLRWENVAGGIKIFAYGLFKKMILADTFSRAVSWGFANVGDATSGDWFLIMLFYTFEIYFDFSGYTDMAVGVSNMINISLPMNFDSPYKALSIRDFWKRWHMSLTGFLTKYVYIPLGGSRKGSARTCLNIMLVFLVSGLWHGANWTFILWGCIHGILQIIERIFHKTYHKLSEGAKWFYGFFSVNLLWLLFRSETIAQWLELLGKMFSFQNMAVSDGLINSFVLPENTFLFDLLHLTELNGIVRGLGMVIFTVGAFLICLVPDNNYRTRKKLNVINLLLCAIAFVWGFLCLSSESVFVYFNF